MSFNRDEARVNVLLPLKPGAIARMTPRVGVESLRELLGRVPDAF